MVTGESLLREFQTGSREAFEDEFAPYREPLFRRRLRHRERAEDLAKETFLAVIRGRERYEPRASVKACLYGIALRLLFAERREQVREAPASTFESVAPGEDTEASL